MELCNPILSLSPHLGHHKDYMASISHLCLRNPCNFTGTTVVDCLQIDCFHRSWQAVVINQVFYYKATAMTIVKDMQRFR